MKVSKLFLFVLLAFCLSAAALPAFALQNFNYHRSDISMSVIIEAATFGGEAIVTDDEIGVFTPGGVCAGADVWVEGQDFGLAAWGDDEWTEVIDGFQQDEALSFRIWLHDENQEYAAVITAIRQGNAVWEGDHLVMLSINVNGAPELAAIGDQAVNEGELLSFNLSGFDPDGDGLSYGADGLPEGASLDGDAFAWTPGYGQAGLYDVTFRVTDDGSPALSDSEAVTITVTNVNRPPEIRSPINDFTLAEDAPQTAIADLDTVFTSPHGEALQFGFSNPPEQLQLEIDPETHVLSVQPLPDYWVGAPGLEVIVCATDLVLTAADTFLVTVSPVNDPPEPFNLVSPEDGYRIAYNPDSLATLEFVWEKAIQNQYETDTVRYWVVFTSGMVQYTVGLLDSTHYAVPIQSLADSMGFSRETELTLNWLVWAQDSEEHEFASNAPWKFTIPALDVTREKLAELPDHFYLSPNYPNPFNSQTTVGFDLPKTTEVEVELFDVQGRKVRSLLDRSLNAGHHRMIVKSDQLSSGLYLLRMKTPDYTKTIRVLLVR
jgi:hypothetical protein